MSELTLNIIGVTLLYTVIGLILTIVIKTAIFLAKRKDRDVK